MPASQRELATLTRDLEVNMRLYVAMLDESQQLGVAKSGTMGVVRIVDAAMVPSLPMFPRPGILLASALIAGLVGGTFLAAFLKATRDRVESAADLERAAEPRCLASIRQSPKQGALQRRADRLRSRGDPALLALAFPRDPAMEGLRRLRAAVLTESATKDGGVILIAGMTPGIGRGFVLANLGVMLVGSGQRTVLVDVDLEQRSLQRNFPSVAAGLSEWLLGDAENLDEVIESGMPGQPDKVSAGLRSDQLGGSCLTPQRLRSLFGELRQRYDYVLVNAPPLSTFADSLVVATAVDGVILVARQLRHRTRQVAALDQRLERAGVNVIGTVLNQVLVSDRLGYLGPSALA
jgi:tyrosine-protein kinase Etk/Wzc